MFKLLATFLCTAAFASAIFAQNIIIAEPKANTKVTAGSKITVQLAEPLSIARSKDVAVVIGIVPCASATACPDVSQALGDILYSGPYTPERHSRSDWSPYQNFTVTIPSLHTSIAQLGVAYFYLIGADQSPVLQVTSTRLDVIKHS